MGRLRDLGASMLLAKIAIVEDVRSAERRDIAEESTLRLEDRPCNVAVFNLSATGCLVRADVPLSPGLQVRIGLPGVGAFGADVVRIDGARAGCRFHHPLSPAQLERAFKSEVVIDGAWKPEPGGSPFDANGELSARAKMAVVVGLSCGLWGVIALAVAQLV